MDEKTKKKVGVQAKSSRKPAARNQTAGENAAHGELLQQIMDTASVAIFLVDMSGRIIHANQRMAEMFGYQMEELVGTEYVSLVHPSERETGRQKMLALMSSQIQSVDLERLYWRKDGSEFWGHLAGRRFHDSQGNKLGLIGVITDINERKRSEQALTQSEEKYRRLYNETPVLLHSIDRDARIVEVNEYWLKNLGYERSEVIGRKVTDFYTDESKKYAEEVIQPAFFKDGIANDIPYQFIKKNGDVVDVLLSATAERDDAGNVVRSQAVIEDVTERKRSEQKISKYSDDLQRLIMVSREMTATTDVTRLYRVAVQTAVDLLGFDFSSIMILSEDKACLTIVDTLGFPQSMIGHFSLVEGQGLSTYVIQNNRTEIVADFLAEDRFEVPAIVHKLNIRSALCVPMMVEESVFGVLIGHTLKKREFSDEEIAIYESIGNEAAIAIKNALTLKDLAESEKRYQRFIEQSPVAISIMDKAGHIEYTNRKHDEIVGHTVEDVPTLEAWWAQVYPDAQLRQQLKTSWAALSRRILSGEEVEPIERTIVCKDGARKDVEMRFSLTGDKILSFFTDITGRKRAEEALIENQARLDLALQSAHMGVWHWEIREDRRYFDDRACLLLGIDAATLTGTAEEFFQAVHPEDRENIKAALSRTIEQDLLYELSYRVVWPDSSVRYITSRGRAVRNDKGQPLRIHGILWDITRQRLLEQELIKAQKLESVGTLAGGIAHDFNNLLQGVFGYISMARLTYDQREKSLAMLEQAEKALHLSVNLTSQLLTFSKGGMPIKKLIDLRLAIENAVKFALSGSSITADISFSDDLRWVDADEGQLGQVIQNIVINAEQAMPLGGTIEISARNRAASKVAGLPADLRGDLVMITIRDAGTGIPAEHLPNIFDPFFTTKEKGSGLGLATSYSIIRNHGGVIQVSSEHGKGSTFTIYLPASCAAEEQATIPREQSVSRKGRILVMDDEKTVRDVASALISSLGHEVALSNHGESAIAQYRSAMDEGRPFDVVLLDLTIKGGMGGLETLQKLLEIDPEVKAVVSSGYSNDTSMSDFRAKGFKAFLNKPYNIASLNSILNDMMATG